MSISLQILVTFLSSFCSLLTGIIVGLVSFRTTSKYQIHKDRLDNLYRPLYVLFDELNLKYGAHEFSDLNSTEKNLIIETIKSNVVYADQALYQKYIELRWAIKGYDIEHQQTCYVELQKITSNDFESIRLKIKLPKLFL